MSSLDAALIRRSLSGNPASRLDDLELFASIDSTNTYLLAQPSPDVGRHRVAISDFQTMGRGRHDRRWLSPPGSGLCLSLAYTFAKRPEQLPGLTLALGLGVVGAMEQLHIDGVSLKWPNDLVALDGKLGGLLTEIQPRKGDGVTAVAGIGLNIDLPERPDFTVESEWTLRAVDLKSLAAEHPCREVIAAAIIETLYATMARFEEQGFAGFADEWRRHDWLHGREITVDMQNRRITGVAAGVDADGALFVDTGDEKVRVLSGSIVMASITECGR
ncbi:MAG: biotin--[acetyl-CoA-carboxylase] ligase [Proteobacteria bacterium]|nr:biotin--[acetyl-CoA-carboxylase] ligase [Pseudomonadota bacterium]MCH8867710.1 biotin--[acetyl-CoA-carboxylase] ligase [Pseudomonadota bacterium]